MTNPSPVSSAHIVPPDQIQAELTRIWDSFQGTKKMRACLFNLILYTQKNERVDYIRNIAQKVIEKFPSRVILITADKSNEDYLKTAVSVMSAGTGEYDIACDLIEIAVSGGFQERIPFMVLPHIAPDLPVYLVWAEDPLKQNPISYQLEKFASRIIFDSETTDNLPLFAASILHHQKMSHADIADLNWARLENWRDLFTTTFMPQDRCDDLRQMESLQINYNTHESPFFCHTKIQAIYLQAWLAAQLGWKFDKLYREQEALVILYTNQHDKTITISLIPTDHPNLAPGFLISAELFTFQGKHYSFARNLELPHRISVTISNEEKCEIPLQYVFPKIGSGHSLVKEICSKGTSEHFVKMLNFIAQTETFNQC